MEWPAKDILISLEPLVFEKSMDLVLSSPKWIDSLLFMNHWHSDENSLFKNIFNFSNVFMLVEDTGFICIEMFIVFIFKTTVAKDCFAFLLKIVGRFVDIQIFFRAKCF